MRKPDVVVVVPVYQQPGLLTEAVLSVLDQDLNPPPVAVLVNDGCPLPESDEECRLFRRAHPESILYVRQRNRGLAAARNTGIAVALECFPHLEAVYFLDADNRLERHCLRRMLDALRTSGAGWVFPDIDLFGIPSLIGMAGEYSVLEHVLSNVSDAGSMVGRAVLDAGVRFDETMRLGLEDWEFWLQAIQQGFRGHHARDVGFRYRRRPESMLQATRPHHGDVVTYIRGKHAGWINPRSIVTLEHEEAPRYAIVEPGGDTVWLCTDPSMRGRPMPLLDFVVRAGLYSLFLSYRFIPRYLVVACEPVLSLLKQTRCLASVLWLLETAAAKGSGRAAFASCIQMAAVESLFDAAEPVQIDFDPGCELPSGVSSAPFLDQLRNEIKCQRDRLGTPFPVSSTDNGRHKDSLTPALNAMFHVRAFYPVATLGFRVGFLAGSVSGELLDLARIVRSRRFSAILFLAAEQQPCFLPEWREVFDALTFFCLPESAPESTPQRYMGTPLPPDLSREAASDLIGLLSPMDLVVNHELTGMLPLTGPLRSLRTKTVFSVLGEDDRRERLELAAAFEHVLAGALVGSGTVRERAIATGFPPSKISTDLSVFLPSCV
jgi:glycosyltransferase involved in cell wall biosynthesis